MPCTSRASGAIAACPPAYRAILRALAADGYNVTRAIRGQDGLWKFLTEASGLKGVEFPEYRDRP